MGTALNKVDAIVAFGASGVVDLEQRSSWFLAFTAVCGALVCETVSLPRRQMSFWPREIGTRIVSYNVHPAHRSSKQLQTYVG
jgi:hypothetical protein